MSGGEVPARLPGMRKEANVHVQWLLDAMAVNAQRHDSFEIERHFAIEPTTAVELGRVLHGIATDDRAVSAVTRIARSRRGEVIIEYRSVDGAERCMVAPRGADGRLGLPTFQSDA